MWPEIQLNYVSRERKEPPNGSRPGAGAWSAAGYQVIGLQPVGSECVDPTPEVEAKGAIDFLTPARNQLFPDGVEALCPMQHGELIIVRLFFYLLDLESVIDCLSNHLLQAHATMCALPQVTAGEL